MNPGTQKTGSKEDMEIIQFSNSSSFNLGYVFFSLAAVISIGATFFFWSANNNVSTALAEKKNEKDSIIADITSPTYKDVEKNAADFKAAVIELKQVSAEKYSISEFLPELYKHITKDVQVKNISVKNKTEVAFDGTTSSYRSVADLVVALRTWSVISDVTLNSASLNVGKDGKSEAVFSITAKIDPTKKLKEEPATTSSDAATASGDTTTSSDTSSDSVDSTQSTTNTSSSASTDVTTPSESGLTNQAGGRP